MNGDRQTAGTRQTERQFQEAKIIGPREREKELDGKTDSQTGPGWGRGGEHGVRQVARVGFLEPEVQIQLLHFLRP